MPTRVRGLELRGCGEEHIHLLSQLLLIALDSCLGHAWLILNAINAVINRSGKAIEIEIEGSEWVVGPKDRLLQAQPAHCQPQTGSEQTAIDLETES